MVKKKAPAGKGSAGRKKSASKRTAARPTKRKRAVKAVRRRRNVAARKPAAKRPAANRARTRGRAKVRREPIGLGGRVRDLDLDTLDLLEERGLGLEAGGQAGDTEGLSRSELAAPESVEELVEEGQAFEAGIVDGVENAPNADRGPIRTREVPEDDVPEEYIDQDRDRS